MDYFNQLLESYNRLKKRTFKLEYICEQGDPNELTKAELNKATGKSVGEPYFIPGTAGAIWQSGPGITGGFYTFSTDYKAYRGGAWNTVKVYDNADDSGFQDLRAFLSGESSDTDQVEEVAPPTPGDKLEDVGISLSITSKEQLSKINQNIANVDLRQAARYRTDGQWGLENQLINNHGITLDEEGNKVATQSISPHLAAQAIESFESLSTFGSGKGDCDDIVTKVGLSSNGKQLFLFGDNLNEGIAVNKNQMHEALLERVKDDCGIETFNEIKIIGKSVYSAGEISQVRGNINEVMFEASLRISSGENLRTVLTETVTSLLKNNIKLLEAGLIATVDDLDSSLDLETAFIQEEIKSQISILDDPEKLKKTIIGLLKVYEPLAKKLNAVGIERTGLATDTGDKSDSLLYYNTEEDAKAAYAKYKIPPRIIPGEESRWSLPVGLKIMKEMKSVKAGEVASISREMGLMNNSIKKGVGKRFYKAVTDVIYSGNKSREKEVVKFTQDLEKNIDSATSFLNEQKTFINDKGELKKTNTKETINSAATQIINKLNYSELKKSDIAKLFIKNGKPIDLTDQDSLNRLQEKTARLARSARYRQMLNSGDKKEVNLAIDSILHRSALAGLNQDDMLDVIHVDGTGDTFTISHNEVFKSLIEARKSNNLQIKSDPGSTTFTMEFSCPNNPEVKVHVTWGQEGASSGSDRNTRSTTKFGREAIRCFNLD